MNHKVFRSIFVIAVALGIVSVMARIKDDPPAKGPAAPAAKQDPVARPLASYRISEEKIDGGIDYLGANFKARVSERGSSFGRVPETGSRTADREYSIEFGTPRIEQGSLRLECERGRFVRPAFGVGQIDRGAVTEEYLFENRRVEQIYRFPVALAEGALRLCIPVKTDLTGPVVAHEPNSGNFEEAQFLKGGLAFCDRLGRTQLAYHSALAFDAEDRRVALMPRYQNGEVVLEVPADFMAKAAYPIVIDPWLEFAGSGSGGGITNNGSASQRPALALTGAGLPMIAWSDNSAANTGNPTNFDIYVKFWNGFEWKEVGSSGSSGGISANLGRSINPSLVVGPTGIAAVAWEDDSSGNFAIYVKATPDQTQAGSGGFQEFAGSATGFGVNGTTGPAEHPSVGLLRVIVPGSVTFDAITGVATSTPPQFHDAPVVAWDEALNNGVQVWCRAFYPGAPAIPDNPVTLAINESQPAVPAGWYQMGPVATSSTAVNTAGSISQSIGGFGERPSLVVDGSNQVAVAWQDTRNLNYEIMLSKWSHTGLPYQVLANGTSGFVNFPSVAWAGVSTSAAAGGISNTGTLSQFPCLAADPTGANNLIVAWQETELSAVPNTASSAQIYVARSVGGGGWAGLGGSTGAGGLSQAAAGRSATSPSIHVGGNYVGVAWADDSNQRSSVYVRRFFLGVGGVQWEQVGFQGSAFPTLGTDPISVINGVSQSLNYAYQPQIRMDFQGSPTVAWADGSGSTFDILLKTFSPNGPGVADIAAVPPTFTVTLQQTLDDPTIGGGTPIPIGGFSAGTSVFLSTRMFTETLQPAGTMLRLEIEIQPAGAAFTFQPTHQTLFGPPDSPATFPAAQPITVLKFDGLPNANYHWQARTIDQIGRRSPWISFGELGGVSFRINAGGAPGGGTGSNGPNNGGIIVGTAKNKSQCGLTGLEAVALLAALRLLRRRRA